MTFLIFAIGTLVTLVVCGAMTLLIWGAILDGRTEAEERIKRLAVVRQEGNTPEPVRRNAAR